MSSAFLIQSFSQGAELPSASRASPKIQKRFFRTGSVKKDERTKLLTTKVFEAVKKFEKKSGKTYPEPAEIVFDTQEITLVKDFYNEWHPNNYNEYDSRDGWDVPIWFNSWYHYPTILVFD